MNTLKYLNSNQISELKNVVNDLYNYKVLSNQQNHSDEDTLFIQLRSNANFAAVTSIGPLFTVRTLNPMFITGFLEMITKKNYNKSAKDTLFQLEKERIKNFKNDLITKKSVEKLEKTDFFNTLKDKIAENIEKEIGEKNWELLEEKTKIFIITAEILKDYLYFIGGGLDYSPPTLNYCKAIENELNEKLFIPFKNHHASQFKFEKQDLKSRIGVIIHHRPSMNLTLGEHLYILRNILNKKVETEIEIKYRGFITISNYSLFGTFINDLHELTKYYRNRSSHTELLDDTQCLECRDKVLSNKGLLISILEIFTNN